MTDMLVRLYDLPASWPVVLSCGSGRIVIRRAMSYEQDKIVAWVVSTFNKLWAEECRTAFGRLPIGCHIAVHAGSVVGFCCSDTTFANFVGPIGVDKQMRTKGIGKALLMASLFDQKSRGHAYAVVGDAGEQEFFRIAVGAEPIIGSTPGAYPERLT